MIFGVGLLFVVLMVMVVNVVFVFGCLVMGLFIDCFYLIMCILIFSVGVVVGMFFFWGFVMNMVLFYVFCIMYGFFVGLYILIWFGVMRDVNVCMEVVVCRRSGGGE